jgi:nondiscriminating glutamyl-tRNA synthetase
MSMNEVRVRFAPSPTGSLHVGNARTAVFNYLFSKLHNGALIVRIEDTDVDRSHVDYERELLQNLEWLGVAWDEGPSVGGERGPYRQSERLAIYRQWINRLLASGRAYPCYCTEEELEHERKGMLAQGMAPRYRGRCRNLDARERVDFENRGIRPCTRFRIEGNEPLVFQDLIRGEMRFQRELLGDFIVMRSSGMPSYNFAVVVDDVLMGITHLLRGNDHLANTPRQMLLYEFFGLAHPVFAHHSLLLAKDRTKLSKRHGATSVSEFRAQGYLPEALFNYLAFLGGGLTGGREILRPDEIAQCFSLEKTGKGGAVFDPEKLTWMNERHLRSLDGKQALKAVKPFLDPARWPATEYPEWWMEKASLLVMENISTLSDAEAWLRIFHRDEFELGEEAYAVVQGDGARSVVRAFKEELSTCPALTEDTYRQVVSEAAKKSGMRGRSLLMPLRAAVTGMTRGPDLASVLTLLGKDLVVARLDNALKISLER